MKKVFKLTDLCCASCAAEIERDVLKLDGVVSGNVNFVMQKMTVELKDDIDVNSVLKKVSKIVKKIEPDCEMIEL